MNATVGVDLGGTHLQVGVVSEACEIVGRSSAKTEAHRGPAAVLDTIAEHVRLALARAGLSRADAVGLTAPGAVDPERGLVLNAPNIGWDDVPAAAELQRRLDMPVTLDNDVNAAVFAEQRLGAGRETSDLLGVWIGTGIGGGLVFRGEVYHGPRRTAGEIGHIIIEPGHPQGRTELEHHCSRSSIARDIGETIARGEASSLAEAYRERGTCSASEMASALRAGDALTLRVVTRAGERLGHVIGAMVTMLSLECVVVGGGLVEEAGDFLVGPIRRGALETLWPEELRTLEVRPTELGPNAGLLGAALLSRARLGRGA